MRPSLSRNGLLLGGVGALFVLSGALLAAWPLLALGFLLIGALAVLYVLFVPRCAMYRRRQLEFAWWVPPSELAGGALTANRRLTLRLLFRNHSPLRVHEATVRILCSSAIDLDAGGRLALSIPPQREVRLRLGATPRAAGHWHLQGIAVRIADRFGVFVMHAYFPSLLEIKVFPRYGLAREPVAFRPHTGASHERAGPRLVRQRGLGSDLRELREHTPGDPFKSIAWKATARTGKLMVREHESEILVTQQLLLDISPSMREGRQPGNMKLDAATSICAGLARAALDAGDRVGLLTFDTRIYTRVKPGDGRPHLFRLIEALMAVHNVVDEDLTDVTDAELCTVVADYLAYQEGINVRLGQHPPQSSRRWRDLVFGSHGELIDLDTTTRVVRESLRQRPADQRWTNVVASSDPLALLRLFCRRRGIELPYRSISIISSKHRGMAEAISEAAASRASRFIVLVSDLQLGGAEAARDDVLRTLQLARRKRHSIVVVTPTPPLPSAAGGPHATRLLRVHELREHRRRREVQRAIEALGIPVVTVSNAEQISELIYQLSRGRLVARPLARAG